MLTVYSIDGSSTIIGWNLRRDYYQDKRVRQAMLYAIDRKKIVEIVESTPGISKLIHLRTMHMSSDDVIVAMKVAFDRLKNFGILNPEEVDVVARRRGLSAEEATALVVNGFVKDVLQQLPMEFAVEAQKLVAISLEGSVG